MGSACARNRCVAFAVLVAAMLLSTIGSLATQPQSAVAGVRGRCNAIKGKRLLRNRSVIVAARTEGERREYAFICVPPDGRVHLAGWAFDETVEALYSVKVLASAGSWVAIQFSSQVDFHGGEELGKMCDARNGRCFHFFHAFTYGSTEFEEAAAEQPVLAAVAVNPFGDMLLGETLRGTTHVVGVGSDGSESILDSAPAARIPPSSLKLVGHEASWIDGGTVRRALLATERVSR